MSKKKDINGLLLLDKPLNISSNNVLQRVRWLFSAKKAGHTGALDPLATGLLPLCFGETTKFSDYFLEGDKTYRVVACLGVRTTTSDLEGEIVSREPVPAFSFAQLDDFIQEQFTGQLQQQPSIWSALKYQGKPFYEYARRGIEIPRPVRDITIYKAELLRWEAPYLEMVVECSKGTYIRTFIDDIGQALGCGAHVHELERTGIDGLNHIKPVSLATLEQLYEQGDFEAMEQLLLPIDFPTLQLEAVELSDFNTWKICQGMTIIMPGAKLDEYYRIYSKRYGFLGVAKAQQADRLRADRVISQANGYAQELKAMFGFENKRKAQREAKK